MKQLSGKRNRRGFLPAVLLLSVLTLILAAGCEGLFTQSLFSSFAADPSEMSAAQLEVYSQGLVGSGDTEAMAEAFTALEATLPADPADDPELYLLATDLAMGGSGLTDVVLEVADMAISGDIPSDPAELTALYNDIMQDLNVSILTQSVAIFEDVAALSGAEDIISSSQYANAAAAMVIVLLDEAAGDPDSIDTLDPRYDLAQDWASLAGIDIDTFLP